MNVRTLGELVAEYVDRIRGWPLDRKAGSARQVQAQRLLEMAEQLRGILVPVKPAPGFRQRLHADLIRGAQHRDAAPPSAAFVRHRKEMLIGAAALGSAASLAGLIIALILHHRHARAANVA